MKDQESNRGNQQEADQSKKSLNVLHREPGAPTAGGPDREPASGEESSEGTLKGVAQPSGKKTSGALSGLDEGETWENDSERKTKATPAATLKGKGTSKRDNNPLLHESS